MTVIKVMESPCCTLVYDQCGDHGVCPDCGMCWVPAIVPTPYLHSETFGLGLLVASRTAARQLASQERVGLGAAWSGMAG